MARNQKTDAAAADGQGADAAAVVALVLMDAVIAGVRLRCGQLVQADPALLAQHADVVDAERAAVAARRAEGIDPIAIDAVPQAVGDADAVTASA